MISRVLGEEPATDTPTHMRRMVDDVIGAGVLPALARITLEGMGVPGRTPTPGAPTPGVTTARRATGATGRATQPLGTPTVLQ